ncbi:Retrovirus-related Pol polyprotein from transposon TNT 1-94 [Sesamum angolense]|uniref:Retrovirus-related Pol polyprotein from transposon TNT 1-94 n=1 Tax=Sesamum angolense TaxID=2727404 RepID=A0AAE1T674_9LAMI|nr:Retrovirus-related Pol polyprotein from transposon TNT 1-94 [Sesamum angolense]
MIDSKSTSVPLAAHFQLCKDQCPKTVSEKEQIKNTPYSNAIGSIMYLMVSTRPDIAYAISCLSRYMSNPGPSHWEALKWLLRYLNGSDNYGITFSKNPQGASLVGYNIVALSTTEAEYIAQLKLYKEAIWLEGSSLGSHRKGCDDTNNPEPWFFGPSLWWQAFVATGFKQPCGGL